MGLTVGFCKGCVAEQQTHNGGLSNIRVSSLAQPAAIACEGGVRDVVWCVAEQQKAGKGLS
jgi:hypothetical protein